MNKIPIINKLVTRKRQVIRLLILASIILIYILVINKLGNVDKTSLVSTTGRTFEKAVVTDIIQDNIQENGTRAGEQTVEVRMLSVDLRNNAGSGRQYRNSTDSTFCINHKCCFV